MTGAQTTSDGLAPLAPGLGAAVVKRPVTRRVDLPAGLAAFVLCRGFPERALAAPR